MSATALLDEIADLEQQITALSARRDAAIHGFAVASVESAVVDGDIEPTKVERSIVAQIALACRVSPFEGQRRLRIARDLRAGLTAVREMFAAGEVSERKVAAIVAAAAHLDPAARAAVDRELTTHSIATLGVRRVGDLARSIAAAVAPEAFLARVLAARTGRRVTIRPAADGMADLTAHLPVEQAVACYAALAAAFTTVSVAPEPLTRGRGQVMADTLVERLTGQAVADDVNIQVQVVVPVEALLDPGSPLPAEIPGHGPVPLVLLGRPQTWRRLITRNGIVIGGDTRQRRFTKHLDELIRARDGGRCREPYCDAPIREIDHIHRWADGGVTSFNNGRGLCTFHNQVRETADWRVTVADGVVTTTTPTGHMYVSAPTAYEWHTTAPAPARTDRVVPLARADHSSSNPQPPSPETTGPGASAPRPTSPG